MGWPEVGPQVPGTTQARQLGDSAGSQAQRPLGPGLYPCMPSNQIKTSNVTSRPAECMRASHCKHAPTTVMGLSRTAAGAPEVLLLSQHESSANLLCMSALACSCPLHLGITHTCATLTITLDFCPNAKC